MKAFFEEYGKTILAIIAVAFLFAFIFGGVQLYKVLGDAANVKTKLNHSQSEQAVLDASNRNAPVITVPDTAKLHLYVDQDQAFKPIETVSCVDAEGNAIVPTVTSIVFIDKDGVRTEHIDDFDKDTGEFDVRAVINQTGALAVTFSVVDSYNVVSVKTISYVIDAGNS